MNGLFVTGTDTDVGKTVLSALLLAAIRERGIQAAPMKPAQTGCSRNVPDLDYSLSMSNLSVSPETYRSMAPYTFEPACSPHLAAEMAGVNIEMSKMLEAAESLHQDYEFILAEGAGGIMVPINEQEMMLDLMKALNLPVVVAARPGLGTINHTLLSVRTLQAAGLQVKGVVIVASTPEPFSHIEKDNVGTIARLGNVPVLGILPHYTELSNAEPAYSLLPNTLKKEVEQIVDNLNL